MLMITNTLPLRVVVYSSEKVGALSGRSDMAGGFLAAASGAQRRQGCREQAEAQARRPRMADEP
jgi:hypothetical protein